MPAWMPFDSKKRATMILDRKSRLSMHRDKTLDQYWPQLAKTS
jgi:hypothetical protein